MTFKMMTSKKLFVYCVGEYEKLKGIIWAATRGVNEETLLENLPEDVQRDIRRHLFKFIKKVSIKIN